MVPVFEDPAVADTELVEHEDIPCHAPQIEDKKAYSSEHREDQLHRVNPIILLDNLHEIEDKQQADSKDGHNAHTRVQANQAISLGRGRLRLYLGQGLQLVCLSLIEIYKLLVQLCHLLFQVLCEF